MIGYGPDYLYMYRRAPVYVERILKGAKPADLPVEQPTKVEVVINMDTEGARPQRAVCAICQRH